MIENAMAAIGASLAAGIPWETVATGLRTFINDAEHNPGRLNIYDIDGKTVILDFAHNEAGLAQLIAFARSGLAEDARLITIIGTAGDRTDESLQAIGKVAAEESDIVIAKGTAHYLRGRSLDSLMAKYREGAESGGVRDYRESASELTATIDALEIASPGDCIVIMAQEHVEEIRDHLKALQATTSS
jgi:cyanophycin synthetase